MYCIYSWWYLSPRYPRLDSMFSSNYHYCFVFATYFYDRLQIVTCAMITTWKRKYIFQAFVSVCVNRHAWKQKKIYFLLLGKRFLFISNLHLSLLLYLSSSIQSSIQMSTNINYLDVLTKLPSSEEINQSAFRAKVFLGVSFSFTLSILITFWNIASKSYLFGSSESSMRHVYTRINTVASTKDKHKEDWDGGFHILVDLRANTINSSNLHVNVYTCNILFPLLSIVTEPEKIFDPLYPELGSRDMCELLEF